MMAMVMTIQYNTLFGIPFSRTKKLAYLMIVNCNVSHGNEHMTTKCAIMYSYHSLPVLSA